MGFLDFLTKKKLDGRADLAVRFHRLVMAKFPGATMTATGPLTFRVEIPGRKEITVFLENLFRQIDNETPEDRDQHIQRHFDSLISSSDATEEAITKDQIVPMIKDQGYLDQACQVGKGAQVVKEHLAADLWIVYAADRPKNILTVKQEQLDELGIAPESLRALSLRNLWSILPPIEKHGDGAWFLLTAGGDYVASILLLNHVWEELQQYVEGDLVVAVPTRDVILVTGSASAEGITEIRARSLELEQRGAYAISQTLLRRKGGHWTALS